MRNYQYILYCSILCMHHEMVCRQHDGRFQSSLDGSLTNGVIPQCLGTGGLLRSPRGSLELVMKGKIPAPNGNQTPVIHLTVTLLTEITQITLQFEVYSDSASSLLCG